MRVVPLVLEHFGRWSKKSETYLDDLSNDQKITLENQTGQSLKTIAVK